METLVILGAVYLLTQERKSPSSNPQPTIPKKTPAEEASGIVKEWVDYLIGLGKK